MAGAGAPDPEGASDISTSAIGALYVRIDEQRVEDPSDVGCAKGETDVGIFPPVVKRRAWSAEGMYSR